MKTLLLTSLIVAMPLLAQPASAADEINVAPGISAAGAPLALHGADPVSLLDTGLTATGTADYAATHDGASYYFASADNLAAFEANPARYVVQNGGFCTFGVSVGKKFDGNPRHFAVHDEKIFVFLNAATRDSYLKDVEGTIATADANWARIEHTAAADL